MTAEDLSTLEQMLVEAGANTDDIARATEESQGLGLFVRSFGGLDRAAAFEAFSAHLDERRYTIDQVRFVNVIVEDLTANEVMQADRLFEPPLTDDAPQGPMTLFQEQDVEGIVQVFDGVRATANPDRTVA